MKKEEYFTEATIGRKADELLGAVRDLRRRKRWTFDPDRSALMILDMQEFFLDSGSHAFVPSGPAILPRIKSLIDVFERRRRPVVFSRQVNTAQDAGLLAKWWRDLILESNPLSSISRDLDVSKGQVVRKTQYDAFSGTDLEGILKSRDATQVVICGVMAHLCCETTARSAFMRGFEVFFTVDATASPSEAFHAATLLNLSHGFATPVLAAEISTAFEATP